MKVSNDLSVSRNEAGCVTIFSWSLGKCIIVTDDELFPLIEALQVEHSGSVDFIKDHTARIEKLEAQVKALIAAVPLAKVQIS